LAIARKAGDRRMESSALGNLGRIRHANGEFRAAVDLHELSLGIAREIDDKQLVVRQSSIDG